MSDYYIGQIEAFPYGYVPKGWAPCNGALLAIQSNQALFSLLGITYGGDGITTFALPDLRGRVAMGIGAGPGLPPTTLGQKAGEETHTLTAAETPSHPHAFNARVNNTTGGASLPGPQVELGSSRSASGGAQLPVYAGPMPAVTMTNTASAGGQAHENRMPYVPINYCIALVGVFPSRP
jgi:microcystin-dependent protein